MTSQKKYRVLSQAPSAAEDTREFALDVLVGLSEKQKRLDSRYFYDARGSEIFREIMACEEYYPTDCEQEIFENHGRSIVANCRKDPINVIDLGAGDGLKSKILLQQFSEMGVDCRYIPIDISESALSGLVESVSEELPDIEVTGLVSEYSDALKWIADQGEGRRNLLLFLGSNIGNFNRAHACAFLRRQWTSLADGDFALLGFDLKKDIDVLLRAYNDAQGITARFNLNLLERINRELNGDFDLSGFRHYGTYDVFLGAMVSYLVSLRAQEVKIGALGKTFSFKPWEPVFTEYSYKYLETDIADLARDTGYVEEASYSDSRRYFVNSLWRVQK